MNEKYYEQVNLLLQILPNLENLKDFALKGGTAINLFFRDMPRLSVDIDIALVKLLDRDSSIKLIDKHLRDFEKSISQRYPKLRVILRKSKDSYARSALIQSDITQIKVEVNDIIRGSVYPCIKKELCLKAQDEFEKFTEIQTYSFNDIFGGKICAALDRQHPRDLFDVKGLLGKEGFTDELRKTFIVYLISHNRPISELINPNRLDIKEQFKNNFEGMTSEPVTLLELEETREQIISLTQNTLTDEEKEFLITFKQAKPCWDLLGLEGIDKLPAIQWKLQNISKMPKDKHMKALKELERKLGVSL